MVCSGKTFDQVIMVSSGKLLIKFNQVVMLCSGRTYAQVMMLCSGKTFVYVNFLHQIIVLCLLNFALVIE